MRFIKGGFEVLDSIAGCISCQFGPSCEVVLRDLVLPYDRTIVAIYNDHVTGRGIDGGRTDVGLEVLQGTAVPKDQYGYINCTKDGRALRTSSKYFRGEDDRVEGSLCVNLDITGLLIGGATMKALDGHGAETSTKEVFTGSVGELLDLMMQDTVQSTGEQLSMLIREDKVAVVRYLDEKGVFPIEKSTEKVADFLGISRFTVYNYLNKPQ